MAICGRCHREAADGALFCSFCGESIKPVTHPGEVLDALIGQTVAGKYFIHQLLGRGGMGDVYKATHLTLDRPVVLKLLKKLFHSDPSLVQRFHREARAASRLNHPNSITIIDFGQTDDGTLFMAMEYLSGRSLERVIADEGSIQEARAIHICAQILAALAEAHALGIVHRDLKPANVMIEPRRDEPDFVKVLDFGIAKLNEPGQGQGLTQAGLVCGTPGYMSTEQVRGDELDARSDIYAVGVILYEMLTGVLPFESDTPMGLVTKHLVEDPPPLAVRKPGTVVSPALEALVMRALARDRKDRFPSADDMRAALLACGASAPRSNRPTPLPSSTMVFDAGALPQAARVQAVTGAVRGPATGSSGAAGTPGAGIPAESAGDIQSRMTAAMPQSSPPVPPPAAVLAAAAAAPAPVAGTPPAAPQAPVATPARPPAAAPTRRETAGADAGAAQAQKAATPKPPAPRPPAREKQQARPSQASRSKVGLLAGVAAVGAVAVALTVWGITRGSAKPSDAAAASAAIPPGNAQPAPPPEPPAPAPPLVPAAATESSASAAEQPSGARPDVPESAAPETRRHSTESRHPAAFAAPHGTKGIRSIGKELNSIPTPPESSGDGVLTVLATPWALVAVDGRNIGETPRELRLAAGTYHVRATHPALGTREQAVVIKAGKRKIWNPTFAN